MKMLNGVVVILRLFGGAARAWWDDDAPRLGASLAYYTLFAIAPILLVATAIAGSSRDQGNLNGAFGRSGGVLNNTYGDAAFCQHGRHMSDPRNAAHAKKVTQEKKKKHEPAAAGAAVLSEVTTAQSSPALEGSLAVLAKLKDLEFHSRAHLQRLAELGMTVEDELKQKDLAASLSEVYAAQNVVQTALTTLIDAYQTECDRLQG